MTKWKLNSPWELEPLKYICLDLFRAIDWIRVKLWLICIWHWNKCTVILLIHDPRKSDDRWMKVLTSFPSIAQFLRSWLNINTVKAMSKRVGSDIERLWTWISWLTQNRLKMISFKFRVVLCRIRLFPTLISKRKLLPYELPLIDMQNLFLIAVFLSLYFIFL